MTTPTKIKLVGNNSYLVLGDEYCSIDLGFVPGALFAAGNGNNMITGGSGLASITLGDGNNDIVLGGNNNIIVMGSGRNRLDLGSGTGHFVALGGGCDTIMGAPA